MLQIGTRGNVNAQILIVGEAWGAEEDKQRQPFVGASGKELYAMLSEAGIDPNNCYYTNVVNKRPPHNDMKHFFMTTAEAKKFSLPDMRGLFPDTIVLEGLARLEELIEKLQPKIIVALGNYALWALTESDFKISNSKGYKIPTGIINYRGSQLRSRFNNIPVLATYHPSAVLRQFPWRYQVVHDFRARIPKVFKNDWDDLPRNFIIRPTFDVVAEQMNQLLLRADLAKSPLLVTCDIETTASQLECVGFGWSNSEALCIPLICHANKTGYWSLEEEIEVVKLIKKVLEHPNIFICGQNFFYDFQYFWLYLGIRPNYRHDTMLAHHTCFPGTLMGLDYLSSLYCSYHRYWKEDGKEANKNHDDEQRWIYNCRDCVVTYEAMTELWKVIKHYGLNKQYAIQMVRANSATQMMIKGVKIDERKRGVEKMKLMAASMDIENKLETLLPTSIYPRQPKKSRWFTSPQQLAEIFYDVLGQKEILNYTPAGPSRTTDDEALSKIGVREPLLRPICRLIQQYRSMKVFSDFINMKVSSDKRMRATFSPTTETFRYRSSGDVFGQGRNLQNIPEGNED